MSHYKDAFQRTECESTETTVRTKGLLWSGTLLRMVTTGYPRGSCQESCWRTWGNVGRGGKEKQWIDCLAEDLRLFGITGDWSTAALDPGAWYSTVREGGCRFTAACVKKEDKAFEHRQRKREAGKGLHLG